MWKTVEQTATASLAKIYRAFEPVQQHITKAIKGVKILNSTPIDIKLHVPKNLETMWPKLEKEAKHTSKVFKDSMKGIEKETEKATLDMQKLSSKYNSMKGKLAFKIGVGRNSEHQEGKKGSGNGILGSALNFFLKNNPVSSVIDTVKSFAKNKYTSTLSGILGVGGEEEKKDDKAKGNNENGKKANKQTGPQGLLAPFMNNLNGVSKMVDDMAPKLIKALLPFANMINQIPIQKLVQPLLDLIPGIIDLFTPLIGVIQSIPLQPLIDSVVQFVGVLVSTLKPIIVEISPLLKVVLQVASTLFTKIFHAAIPIIKMLGIYFKNIAHIMTVMLTPAVKIVGWILGKVIDAISWVVSKIMPILNKVSGWYSKIADKIGWIIGKTADAVTDDKPAAAAKASKDVANSTADTPVVPAFDMSSFKPPDLSKPAIATKGANSIIQSNTPQSENTDNNIGATKGNEVTSGGQRVVNININKSFVENFSIHAQKVEEGYDKLKERVGQIFLEILNSANAAT